MTDFHNAGGVPAVIKSLEGFLVDTQTVSELSIKEIANSAWVDTEIIPLYEKSEYTQAGLAVLYGNLAKDGCVIKTSGVAPECYEFEGYAKYSIVKRKLWRLWKGIKLKKEMSL